MHILSDSADESGATAQQLLRLQNDFHARLTVETLNYLRGLQSALGPAAPGTVLIPRRGAGLRASSEPGSQVQLRVEVANAQAVHCVVSPGLSPLVAASGVTWFAAAEVDPPYLLIPPGATEAAVLDISVPENLPTGDYRGVLLMHGAPEGIPVTIRIVAVQSPTSAGIATPTATQPSARKPGARKPAANAAAKKPVAKAARKGSARKVARKAAT